MQTPTSNSESALAAKNLLHNCFTAHAFLRHQPSKFIDQIEASQENKNHSACPPKLFADDLILEVFLTTKRFATRDLSKSQRMNMESVSSDDAWAGGLIFEL